MPIRYLKGAGSLSESYIKIGLLCGQLVMHVISAGINEKLSKNALVDVMISSALENALER